MASDKAQSAKETATAKADELKRTAQEKSQPAVDEAKRLKDQAVQKAQVTHSYTRRIFLSDPPYPLMLSLLLGTDIHSRQYVNMRRYFALSVLLQCQETPQIHVVHLNDLTLPPCTTHF